MKRRSFLKIIGLAVAAPSSLAGVVPGAGVAIPAAINPACAALDCAANGWVWYYYKNWPIDTESFDVAAKILDERVSWIGTKTNG
jgi:hypothetical protein